MTLSFQNKIVFPAPESSYTTESSYGQVIYIPRNILKKELLSPEAQQSLITSKDYPFFKGTRDSQQNSQNMNNSETQVQQKQIPSTIASKTKILQQQSSKGDVNSQDLEKLATDQDDFMDEDVSNQGLEEVEEKKSNTLSLHKSMSAKLEVNNQLSSNVQENASDLNNKNDYPNFQSENFENKQENLIKVGKASDSNQSEQIISTEEVKQPLKSSMSTKSLFSFLSKAVKPEKEEYIPCLYIPNENEGQKVVLYFHGNAEDIGYAFEIMYSFGAYAKMHVLCIEYPGYGAYRTSMSNEQYIREDSLIVYDYLTQNVGLKPQDIMLFGRSLGSGPSTYLASQREVYCLYLMSAYTSIKDVARTLLGKLSFILTPIVMERFRNIDNIKNVNCPVFFLHGLKDTLIPYTHAQELKRHCQQMSQLWLPDDMDHNQFDFLEDLVLPFIHFKDVIDANNNSMLEQQKQQLQDLANQNLQQDNIQQLEQKQDQFEEQKQQNQQTPNSLPNQSSIPRRVIDASYVEHHPETKTFDIYFDGKLYNPPQILVDLEKQAQLKLKEKLQSQQKKK